VYEYIAPNVSIVKKHGLVKYASLFVDKIIIYGAIFILCQLHMLPLLLAFVIMAKDNIMSAFKTMAELYKVTIYTSIIDLLTQLLVIATLVVIIFWPAHSTILIWVSAIGCIVTVLSYAMRHMALLKRIMKS